MSGRRRRSAEQAKSLIKRLWPELSSGEKVKFALKYFIASAISNIIIAVFTAALGASIFAIIGAALFSAVLASPIVLLILFVLVFGAILGSLLFLYRNQPLLPSPPDEYHILQQAIKMKYFSRREAEYSRTIRLRVLRDGVDRFHDTYMWSGITVTVLESSDPIHTITKTDSTSQYIHFALRFPYIQAATQAPLSQKWPQALLIEQIQKPRRSHSTTVIT
jgi:hypothetical protein